VLLVRHAPLAGADTPLAFWFVCATLASLRLLRVHGLLDYVVAGALVGICAATKYPGAAVAGGVVAAHLLARRRLLDRRLWTAGAASIVLFLTLSPYTLLDFGTFFDHFLFQFQHAAQGRWGIRAGPLYQLTVTLRHSLGTLAWLGWICVCAWAFHQRPTAHLVVITAMLSGYVAVSWGELVFARYILPLVPLQLALLGDGMVRIYRYAESTGRLPRRWLIPVASALTLILVCQPAYGAWHVARLQGTRDTRRAARDWIERYVPSGSTVCNFGGWAGDPQINTFESLWWRFTKYTEANAVQDLDLLRTTQGDIGAPYYSYAVQTGNADQAPGSINLVHERHCSHVILHEYPLLYSQVDSLIRGHLAAEGRHAVTYDPGQMGTAVYDPMDAYYIPFAGGYPRSPGPRIEIWEVPQYYSPARAQDAVTVLSQALSLNADTKSDEGDVPGARQDLRRAISLEKGNTHALAVLARIEGNACNLVAATSAYMAILDLQPKDSSTMQALALVSSQAGYHEGAIDWYEQARRQQPHDAGLLNNLAVEYRAAGRADSARTCGRSPCRCRRITSTRTSTSVPLCIWPPSMNGPCYT
jgi:tetratricopeptide (TPR) repeat protein